MADLTQYDPTGRFTGLARLYARFRPSYPGAAVDWIAARCALGPGRILVDVGSGTGISARVFAARGVRVIGIEPNAEMRQGAACEPVPDGAPPPEYHDGRAEATGLPASSADAVLAAQAFHWFDPERALREFRRLLKPGGWVILLWNERDESDPFTAAYGAVIRTVPDASAIEVPRSRAGEPLLTSPLFGDAELRVFKNEQRLDREALLGRALSSSYAPREGEAGQAFARGIEAVFSRFQQDGGVVLQYETSVYVARRLADDN